MIIFAEQRGGGRGRGDSGAQEQTYQQQGMECWNVLFSYFTVLKQFLEKNIYCSDDIWKLFTIIFFA